MTATALMLRERSDHAVILRERSDRGIAFGLRQFNSLGRKRSLVASLLRMTCGSLLRMTATASLRMT